MSRWSGSRPSSSSPRTVLDLCCGAGGAARGYRNAGFAVWGVDNNARLGTDYLASGAEKFICADVLDVLNDRSFVRHFDFVHCSFPCQGYSRMSQCRPGLADSYPRLITPGRELLLTAGIPFIIENVSGARPWLLSPMTLCGSMFARPTYRHRLFEPGGGLTLTAPVQQPEAIKRNNECGWNHPIPTARAGHWEPGKYVSVSGHERRGIVNEAMDINWMHDRESVAESVPPYMTLEIGLQVRKQLDNRGRYIS
jgi:DNA (cytosine-5)-methyltransferase 1